ncbi:diguanylate cyclase [Rossellomorea marisflavi]|uniref:Diguanylate cyclase n=1 Tax=Rossellomorea marisflavi TaxID=189381 RepID=A0A5D4RH27_9BACI|nr:diguanylate cyclase [Rossellomorea marisflavi]KQU59296.1 hypothetical protein ASG66_06085 [Bacillus sp. Leaf406]TYS48732.1 diguanylate cyclase [Rossellomorea marisflavi]
MTDNEVLLTYKSNLFDLIYDGEPSTYIEGWLGIMRESWNAERVHLYIHSDDSYLLYGSGEAGDVPLSIMGEEIRYRNPFSISYEGPHVGIRDGLAFADHQGGGSLLLFWSGGIKVDRALLKQIWEVSNRFLLHTSAIQTVHEDERRYRELFNVTEIFHSTRDVRKLLAVTMDTLKRVFPQDVFTLLLANDPVGNEAHSIRHFDLDKANEASMHVFVSGEMKCWGEHVLYAPLKGTQGIYGVLEVKLNPTSPLTDHKKEFVKLLAYTAGSALENAKLYEQSRKVISDLQLINETSHQLNLNLRMSDTLQFLRKQVEKSFQTEDIGFVLFEDGAVMISEESSDLFSLPSGKRYVEFVHERMQENREAIFIGEMNEQVGDGEAFSSLMAVPMLHDGSLLGFCLVLHRDTYRFSFDMYRLFQSFIHHSTLAITNARLREKLEELVITDQMTNLYARAYLGEKMDASMEQDDNGTLLLVDIDDFKSVNDRFGHQVGDEVLVQVADLMKEVVGESGYVARWGGEELAVYLPSVEQSIGALIGRALVEGISEKTSPRVTLSCGVASWHRKRSAVTVEKLVKRADEALYIAKNNGKNRVVLEDRTTYA